MDKTKILIYFGGRPLLSVNFSLNGSEIEIANRFN